MTEAKIEAALKMIQGIIDAPLIEGDIAGAMEKLNKIQAIHGLAAECLKWAKQYTLVKQGSLLPELFKGGLSATMFKYQLESRMASEIALYTYSDRICAALVHCGEEVRTIISALKSERQNLR
jgi:hypothetical protein